MRKYVLEKNVIFGSNVGDKVLFSLPKLSSTLSNVRIPFKFPRKQFSLTVLFAMTINKSQGNRLDMLKYIYQRLCFSMINYMLQFKRLMQDND